LRAADAEVEVRRAKEVRDLSPYQAIVVGTSVHVGRLPGEIPRFVKRHRQVLSNLLVADFVIVAFAPALYGLPTVASALFRVT
jgi:menaquinone-dependent protoporphyrinogen IX oxidase